MNSLISISARMLLLVFVGIVGLRTGANAGSLDERFKTSLNIMVYHVQETQNSDAKRKIIGDFLNRMDKGIGIAKIGAPAKDEQALTAFQTKMRADYAELNGAGVGSAEVPNAELNHYALYVQQDAEQAYQVVYIGGCSLIIIIILLILLLR